MPIWNRSLISVYLIFIFTRKFLRLLFKFKILDDKASNLSLTVSRIEAKIKDRELELLIAKKKERKKRKSR